MIRERIYSLLLSAAVLVALYFDDTIVLWLIIALSVTEAVTGVLITALLPQNGDLLDPGAGAPDGAAIGDSALAIRLRGTPALRAWRAAIAAVLALGLVFPEHLWFVPWFLAFALAGAGASGVCPLFSFVMYAGISDC